MAEVEEPQYTTLAERIAALNKQKNFSSTEPTRKRAPPPPPPPSTRPVSIVTAQTSPRVPVVETPQQAAPSVPARPVKSQAPPPLPRRDTQNSQVSQVSSKESQPARPVPPPLPSRTPSAQSTPVVPSRPAATPRPSLNGRRSSASSQLSLRSNASSSSLGYPLSSASSHGSSGAARKLAPAYNPATLPPLPPSRREREVQAQEAAAAEAARVKEAADNRRLKARELAKETTSSRQPLIAAHSAPVILPTRPAETPKPSLPPRLPSRPSKPNVTPAASRPVQEREASPPPPPVPTRNLDQAPPPVPVSSRPSAAQIDAASARTTALTPSHNDCWVCRDWSGPDGVAAQYPKDSLPRNDPVGYLARHLCDPFPSYTDKARAIFTWFHHNIFYDTKAFFSKNIKHMTPEETIFSGWAVCQGYAETYKAIANRAGLECEVVGGHGKGYGYTPLEKGERPPPAKPDGHAWNAVRIDGGAWKLLDACWGAGHICGANNLYKQEFNPSEFIKPNDKFGRTHFPQNPRFQFRDDGRTISWEEYYIGRVNGPEPTVYTNADQEGIAKDSIEPKERDIPVYSGEVVRFRFSKFCEHWRSETHGQGKPPLLLLSIHGLDGRKDAMVPMETDGYWHWVDVNARDLGAPGQSVQVAQLTSMNGQDARGVSGKEFLAKKGKVGMAWAYVVKWELV
ncbi:Kyphoscoliosis peptidase [Paramyrothecium foliicola]|nr:Kyphoscoliosis peptidase [Paramyrothecium foliicola]